MTGDCLGVALEYQIPDELWERIEPLLPEPKPKKKSGRPRMDDRQAMTAIFYVLRTGCQWKALPRRLGAASTVHDRFQEWAEAGVFERMWQAGLMEYDERVGIEWEWQAMDGAMTKAPLGGKGTGPNPTDRGKSGTKRSLLTEGKGIPLAVAVDGANRHDMKMTEGTLQAIVIERPEPTEEDPQNLCLDKGFDSAEVRELLAAWGYTAHIRRRGEETAAKERVPGYRARRWVVERTHSWLNRFRRLLIRWEKKAENYLAMLHFACAWITFRAAGLFG
ncbi:MAG: IS5 family transposase [Anaerolineae bacterium]|nr:IS5 family transposase [Anaerolineae bacterium]